MCAKLSGSAGHSGAGVLLMMKTYVCVLWAPAQRYCDVSNLFSFTILHATLFVVSLFFYIFMNSKDIIYKDRCYLLNEHC